MKKKKKKLAESGTLNRNAAKVTDELFLNSEFFDGFDLLQVKYEMLRRVEEDGRSVSQVAKDFGFSRRHFYEVQKQFKYAGLTGLTPERRGPKGAHKIDDEVMSFLSDSLQDNPVLKAPALSLMVEKQFCLKVHPRSIERALDRKKKEIKT